MRPSTRYSVISRLGGAVATVWLSVTGSALAGDGSGDIPSAQGAVTELCTLFNMSCPQLPTITQLILQITGLENTSPDIARYAESFSPTAAVNAVNPPAGSNPFDLTKVTPVAFVPSATTTGTATLTAPNDPAAKSFFYAATDGSPGTAPANLILVYDYQNLKNSNFAKNQPVAKLSLPLVILNTSSNTETEAPTTILITSATGCGKATPATPCISATATGSFGTVSAASLGINVTLDFSLGYARFKVQAPLLITQTIDPAYFTTNQAYGGDSQFFYPGLPTSFVNNVLGFTPKFLGSPIGVAPYAAPQCPKDRDTGKPQINCANSSPLPNTTFPFCASIFTDGSTIGSLFPAVAAFYSIGTFGTTYISAPMNTPSNVTCLF
jgi:hypothetical protein